MLVTLQDYDENIYRWFNRFQSSLVLTRLFKAISHSGDGYLYLAIAVLAMFIDNANSKLFVASCALAYLIEVPSFILLKHFFKRNRPYVQLKGSYYAIEPADKFSLPSGHSAAAFLMFNLIAFYYPSFCFIAFIWAVLIGLSRVILGVHYLSDIIAGALLGSLCAISAILIINSM
mgnify:CR=1 FL=1